MPKLATPVEYEPTLEELNTVRPLQLADEGKIVIPYPVLCKNPPTKDRPAVGKLARCTQQGALLKVGNAPFTLVESGSDTVTNVDWLFHYTFTQKVYGVVIRATYVPPALNFWWCTYVGSKLLPVGQSGFSLFLPFVGTVLSLRGEGFLTWSIDFIFMGFY